MKAEDYSTSNNKYSGSEIMTFDLEGDSNPGNSVNQGHPEKSLSGQDVGSIKDYTPAELAKMKKEDPSAYRGVLKIRINLSLDKSSKIIDKKVLIFGRNQRELGKLLKDAERTFNKKSEFMVWLRENFSQHHLRTLEEAMYLAGLGKFAEKFEGISKNSMLAFARIRHDDAVVEFMQQNPDPVINPEGNLTPRKIYVNGVIIYKRFYDREVILTPEQATAIATVLNKPLEINAVNLVAEQILAEPTDEKKAEFIEKWVKDGCPIKHEKKEKKTPSLGGDITQFNEVAKKYNLNDIKVLSEVNGDELLELYQLILNLAQKKGILPPPNQDGEQPEAADTEKPDSGNVISLAQGKVAQAV